MYLEKIKAMISEQLNIPVENIKEESDLIYELNADSLDIVQMLICMEKEFDVEFDDDEIKVIKTVGDVAKFIEDHQSK